jgi:hypothetical protein
MSPQFKADNRLAKLYALTAFLIAINQIVSVPSIFPLLADCVAKVGGTSSDRPKRAILESEGVNF